jgi:hypothetical protein
MPFLLGDNLFSEDNLLPCIQCFKEMHWTKLILLHPPHSWIICIHKSFDSLYSCNLLLFPLHAWTILFRVSVLLLHWWISTTSKESEDAKIMDMKCIGWMGWWVTHNLCVEGFLSKECNTIAILTLPRLTSRVSRTPHPLWRKSCAWLCVFQIH